MCQLLKEPTVLKQEVLPTAARQYNNQSRCWAYCCWKKTDSKQVLGTLLLANNTPRTLADNTPRTLALALRRLTLEPSIQLVRTPTTPQMLRLLCSLSSLVQCHSCLFPNWTERSHRRLATRRSMRWSSSLKALQTVRRGM